MGFFVLFLVFYVFLVPSFSVLVSTLAHVFDYWVEIGLCACTMSALSLILSMQCMKNCRNDQMDKHSSPQSFLDIWGSPLRAGIWCVMFERSFITLICWHIDSQLESRNHVTRGCTLPLLHLSSSMPKANKTIANQLSENWKRINE